jgi:hypothetical protein
MRYCAMAGASVRAFDIFGRARREGSRRDGLRHGVKAMIFANSLFVIRLSEWLRLYKGRVLAHTSTLLSSL